MTQRAIISTREVIAENDDGTEIYGPLTATGDPVPCYVWQESAVRFPVLPAGGFEIGQWLAMVPTGRVQERVIISDITDRLGQSKTLAAMIVTRIIRQPGYDLLMLDLFEGAAT